MGSAAAPVRVAGMLPVSGAHLLMLCVGALGTANAHAPGGRGAIGGAVPLASVATRAQQETALAGRELAGEKKEGAYARGGASEHGPWRLRRVPRRANKRATGKASLRAARRAER